MQNQIQQQMQVNASPDDLKGKYANIMQVSHTPDEFIVDFLSVFPNSQGQLISRLIISPGHMKRIISVLAENVKNYEKVFGTIEKTDAPEGKIGFKSN